MTNPDARKARLGIARVVFAATVGALVVPTTMLGLATVADAAPARLKPITYTVGDESTVSPNASSLMDRLGRQARHAGGDGRVVV